MNSIKKERILLGELLDVCARCTEVPHVTKGTWDVKYCVTNCHHWVRMQHQRAVIEELQKVLRVKKKVLSSNRSLMNP